jgi:glycerophosphoryl diester phosphodiesterase
MGQWFGGARPAIFGHRGFARELPENTLAAFDAALELGALGVELDVRLSREGDAVVIHDEDLARVTGGAVCARVDELTIADLERVALPRGQTVPTLSRVLHWAAQRGSLLNIELKGDERGPELLCAVERELHRARLPPRQMVLSCFEIALAEELRDRLPAHATALLCDSLTPDIERWLAGLRSRTAPVLIHPLLGLLDRSLSETWQATGVKLGVWGVNTAPDLAHFVSLLLQGLAPELVITDDPQLVHDALAALCSPS